MSLSDRRYALKVVATVGRGRKMREPNDKRPGPVVTCTGSSLTSFISPALCFVVSRPVAKALLDCCPQICLGPGMVCP